MTGTNPFEETFTDNRNADNPATSTNPFEDDRGVPSGNSGFNPFENENDNSDADNVEEDTFDTTDDGNVVGAPVEASWQYLGDLPYRRIPIYSNVMWGGGANGTGNKSNHGDQSRLNPNFLNYGLSAFPKVALQRHPDVLDARELEELLNTSTVTKVVGCKYGGPIAAVTLPVVGETSWFSHTDIRIMTNSGNALANIQFPSAEIEQKYSPSDIMEVGFTDRAVFVIILKDSLCLTYDVTGETLLPPFFLLPRGEGQGTDLSHACVFDGGAVRFDSSSNSEYSLVISSSDCIGYCPAIHV